MGASSARPLSPYIARRRLDSSLPLLRLVEREGPLSQGAAAQALGLTQGACNLHFQ